MQAREVPEQSILHAVGVLILVHQDVAKPLLHWKHRLRMLLEKLQGEVEDIIKIKRVAALECALVLLINLPNDLQSTIP